MKTIVLSLIFLVTVSTLPAQAPSIEWAKSYGGTADDGSSTIVPTSDGGYIVSGASSSSDGDVTGLHGATDIWIMKIDNNGNLQWQKTYGGSGDDVAGAIQQTTDGGYIIAGATYSNDGDVSGNQGISDAWILKIEVDGDVEWQRVLGGTGTDVANVIIQDSDGGYVFAGETSSDDGDISGNHGGIYDGWIVKLDNTGNIQWQKLLGGTIDDRIYDLKQTTDGGYIICGNTSSNNGDVSGNHSSAYDGWIVKLGNTGNMQWQKLIGGNYDEYFSSIQQTSDGGFITAGLTRSDDNDGDIVVTQGGEDFLVVKTDNTGNIQWLTTMGGSTTDIGQSVTQTSDGGYIVTGYTFSNDGDVTGNHSAFDYSDAWIIKLSDTGVPQWQKVLGGSDTEVFTSVLQATDGGYIFAGINFSTDGDVTDHHSTNGTDLWIVKLAPLVTLPITLNDINARNTGSNNIISWTTAAEDGGEYFILQRSDDGIAFENIARINSRGFAAGDKYQYTDDKPVTGVNYYRLYMPKNEPGNTGIYSKVVTATVATDTRFSFHIYPNPARNIITVSAPGLASAPATIIITDMTGKVMQTLTGINTRDKIDISTLSSGIYMLSYNDGKYQVTKKLVVQK